MRTTAVSRRYARAIFDVAKERGDPQAWLSALNALGDALSDRDLLESLHSPNISDAQKYEAVEGAFPDLPQEIKNLIRLLLQRHRISILPSIAAAFSQYLDDMMGRGEADVTAARSLSPEELHSIEEHLNRRTGLTIKARTIVDPSLIGGVVIRVGDEVIDASVATRLERLRQRMA